MSEMASKCVTVKQEPPEKLEVTENEGLATPGTQSEPEFVNIKMEFLSDESDLSDACDSPNITPGPSRNDSWNVPVKDEPKAMDEEGYIEVPIKQELVIPNFSAYDSSLLKPTTSTDIIYNEENQDMKSTDRGYSCSVCQKSFANQGNVQRHMLTHTKAEIICDQCHESFPNKISLDKHIFNKHTAPGERKYACDGCDKKFKSSSNLMQHKKVHLVDKPYKCSQCGKSFSFKSNLQKHEGKSRCKVPSNEPLICKVCNKLFKKEYLLKSHLRKHDPDRPYSCQHCSMNFKYKSTVLRHMQLHDGIRPFSCPVCDKTFTHAGLLKPHMRVHTGEKPYQCSICQKMFAHKHNMERHKLRHNRIKHLVCDVCHRQFPKESRLKYHMRTHINEKHFACNICPKRFSHKQNVLRHYSRKHPGQTYSCTDTDASVALRVWDSIKSKYYDDEAEVILG